MNSSIQVTTAYGDRSTPRAELASGMISTQNIDVMLAMLQSLTRVPVKLWWRRQRRYDIGQPGDITRIPCIICSVVTDNVKQ